MSRIGQAARRRVRAWAARRHGRDTLPLAVGRRRVYIVPTRHGLTLAALLAAMAIAGLNYGSNLALAFAFVMIALALVAMHHCHRNLLGIVFDAPAEADGVAGGEAEVPVVVGNDTGVRRVGIAVSAGESETTRVDVDARTSARAVLRIPTSRRGLLRVADYELRTEHPLGWFTAWTYVHAPLTVYVAPAPQGARSLPPSPAHDGGPWPAENRGEEEFAGLRSYVPGTPLKHMAWKVLARGGEPAARSYSGLAGRPRWLEWTALEPLPAEARLGQLARWVHDAEQSHHPYGLRLPGVEITPDRGAAHRRACLRALASHGQRGAT